MCADRKVGGRILNVPDVLKDLLGSTIINLQLYTAFDPIDLLQS
jgi:hypothetical protein